jgi:hypothetical protein
MTDTRDQWLNPRGFVLGTVSGAALAMAPAIAFPSIAAENRNYPQGAEYMADLSR